ncbi:MAG: DinB family protein [Bacteroidota bacterium]|nr:DinB family protein [Bacteroidota bacterium]
MKTVANENLMQLRNLLQNISIEDYSRKTDVLSGSTIGQHIRHVLEFYLLLVSGSFTGTISYDKRNRDVRIQSDPGFAIAAIDKILIGIGTFDENSPVVLEADYTVDGASENQIRSSVGRELAYCIEHSIHHQALIKAALIVHGLTRMTNDHFGVAYSTIRYRENKCAQ